MTQGTIKQNLRNKIHIAQSLIASLKNSLPGRKLRIIGVTGTDGKTTTTTMIFHILKSSGKKVGFISTIKAKYNDIEIDTGYHVTTPDPWDVPKYLRMMVDDGVEYVVLESTSQGLEQNRLFGLKFEVGVITNIKEDHLDYHKTWENYARSKFKLVDMVKRGGRVVLNKDDKRSAQWLETKTKDLISKEIVWCSMNDLSDIKHSVQGISFKFNDHTFKLPIVGKHNFLNALQAINATSKYVSFEDIGKALDSFESPEGRMEIIQKEPFSAIVDFAHTPQALESALDSVNDIKLKNSRVITLFGCAGRRDKGRREMGGVAARLGDIIIATAEDPRDEDLYEVNNDILRSAEKEGAKLLIRFKDRSEFKELDVENIKLRIKEMLRRNEKPFIAFDENSNNSREDALEFACMISEKDDIVFATGKGHEKSLAFGDPEVEYPWSDQEVLRKILKK